MELTKAHGNAIRVSSSPDITKKPVFDSFRPEDSDSYWLNTLEYATFRANPSSTLGTFDLTTAGGTAQRTFDLLAPSVYDLGETVPNGWRLDSATCSDGSNPASVNLAAGEDVTCTFTNTKRGSLTIVKNALYGDATFSFDSQALGNFTLTTVNGTAQQTFSNLLPGTYNVSETVPNGWRLDSATCSDGSNPASVALAAGENVTCTFKNTKQDTIIVVKRTVGGDGAFAFTSPKLGAFTLTTTGGTASRSFTGLAAGAYAVTETVPEGWNLISATCDNGDTPGSITLTAGKAVTCAFENKKEPVPIPTVTGWGLLILSMLLGLVGWWCEPAGYFRASAKAGGLNRAS